MVPAQMWQEGPCTWLECDQSAQRRKHRICLCRSTLPAPEPWHAYGRHKACCTSSAKEGFLNPKHLRGQAAATDRSTRSARNRLVRAYHRKKVRLFQKIQKATTDRLEAEARADLHALHGRIRSDRWAYMRLERGTWICDQQIWDSSFMKEVSLARLKTCAWHGFCDKHKFSPEAIRRLRRSLLSDRLYSDVYTKLQLSCCSPRACHT